MRPVHYEAHTLAAVAAANEPNALNAAQSLPGVRSEHDLVVHDGLCTDAFDPAQRDTQGNRAADVRGARLELVREARVGRSFFEADHVDHLPATAPRAHGLEQCAFAVQHANPRRSVRLVTRKNVEVTVQCLHVHVHVRNGLAPVDQHRGPCGLGLCRQCLGIVDGAERVGHVREGKKFGTLG